MKNFPSLHLPFQLALALMIACMAFTACSSPPVPVANPDTWTAHGHFEPVWSDEFNGPRVDSTKWIVADRHYDWWPKEAPWRRNYKASNVWTQPEAGSTNGILVIRTLKDDTVPGQPESWSTGSLQTAEEGKPALFQQTFGRFEARLKFPGQQGHWCAFWLFGSGVGKVNGNGRDGTEIDIVEKSHTSDWINHALHWDGYEKYHKSEGHDMKGLGLDDGGWHTFRVDWYPDMYVFFVDDKETWRTNAGGVAQTPDWIILSEEIGNFGTGPESWGGGPISEASLPDYFQVDWVRASKWVPD